MDEPQRKPSYPSWNYSFGEIVADGAVHATGVVLGLVGSVLLVLWAAGSAGTVELAAVFVYVAGLLAMLGFSAAYNMWPVSPTKWLLRRFDHSAIYVMIAGTYTPLLLQMKASVATVALLAGVWADRRSSAPPSSSPFRAGSTGSRSRSTWPSAGASSPRTTWCCRRCPPRPLSCSRWAVCSIPVGVIFHRLGAGCGSRTPSGTPSSSPPRPATGARSSTASCWRERSARMTSRRD